MNRRCSDRFVVVGIIQKDSPKVSDQINHEELASSLRSHGEIAASSVAAEGPLACQVCQDLPKLAWGPEDVVGRVRGKRKREDDNEEDQGINVVGDEGRFDSAVQCVNDHADWEEEDSGRSWGPGQEFDDTSTTCEKHGSDEDIREAAEDDEDAVRNGAVSGLHNFQERVGVWSASFQFDSESGEENNLNAGTSCIPKST